MHFSGRWLRYRGGRSLEVAVIQISFVHSKTGRKQEMLADQRGRKWEGLLYGKCNARYDIFALSYGSTSPNGGRRSWG